jgi:hypothetical protein
MIGPARLKRRLSPPRRRLAHQLEICIMMSNSTQPHVRIAAPQASEARRLRTCGVGVFRSCVDEPGADAAAMSAMLLGAEFLVLVQVHRLGLRDVCFVGGWMQTTRSNLMPSRYRRRVRLQCTFHLSTFITVVIGEEEEKKNPGTS